MLKRNHSRTGASRKRDDKKKLDFSFFKNFSIKPFVVLLAVVGNLTVLYYAVFSVDRMLDVPVHHVEVQGQLKYQSRQEIQQVVNNFIAEGYVRSDLNSLRGELLALPWIDKVSLKRRMNNELLVVLEEKQAVAYWNDDGLISSNAAVFKPESLPEIEGLPRLSGNQSGQLINLYKVVSEQLSGFSDLQVAALTLDMNNTVRVVFSNSVVLTMNQNDMPEQLENFVAVMSSGLQKKMSEVATIDLRYKNGAAVSWRKENIAYNENNLGAHK